MLPKPSCLSVSPLLITAFAVVLTANLFTFCRYTSPSVIFLTTLALPYLGHLRTLYTPSPYGKYSSPTSYRVCWHVSLTALFLPWSLSPAFFTMLLCQTFVHCTIFYTAAPLLGPTRVSVLMWLFILSYQLLISVLVGFYPPN